MSFFSDKQSNYSHIDKLNCNVISPNFCQFENKDAFFKLVWSQTINMGFNPINNLPNLEHLLCVYQCASCKKFIAIEYEVDLSHGLNMFSKINYNWSSIYPDWPFDNAVTKILEEVSPDFIETYKEASIAERSNLHEIDIMAYRKAAEILINDVLKHYGYNDNELKNLTLSKKINKLPSYKNRDDIDDKNITKLIAWIGNDGTHIYKKNPQYGLEDIKFLLEDFTDTVTKRIRKEQYNQYVKEREKNSHK